MLKRRIRGWFLKRLGIRLYAYDHQVSEFTLESLNNDQFIRFEEIIKKKVRNELAEKLPIMFVTSKNRENVNVKISAYIYALEIEEKFKEVHK